jgi:phosphonate transport system substrate-binding protein
MNNTNKKTIVSKILISLPLVCSLAFTACTSKRAELGSAENPVKIFFVPSVDAKVLDDASKKLKDFLESKTSYKYEIAIPQSYIAVVEAFGTARADVAALNTFGYVRAFDLYGVEARLTSLRHGKSTYQSQFIVKTGSPIKTIEDLKGKKIAFVDASSASGYLLPLKLLKDKKIETGETVFAMTHDNVVSMVYNGQVDAGATFYSVPDEEGIQDARRLVRTQYPDVEKKVSILQLSDALPNEPLVFRKELSEEMKTKIASAMLEFVQSPDGKKTFKAIYGVDDMKPATDKDYEAVRAMMNALRKETETLAK